MIHYIDKLFYPTIQQQASLKKDNTSKLGNKSVTDSSKIIRNLIDCEITIPTLNLGQEITKSPVWIIIKDIEYTFG